MPQPERITPKTIPGTSPIEEETGLKNLPKINDFHQENLPKINDFYQLTEVLQAYIQTGRELTLKHNTLGQAAIERLLNATQEQKRMAARTSKYQRRLGVGPDKAFLFALAGQLVTLGTPHGPKAREDANEMLSVLANFVSGQITPEPEEKKQRDILTTEDLDQLMLMAYSWDKEGSITQQLNDFFNLPRVGMIVNPSDREDFGFDLPQALLGVLKSLKHQESAKVLREWIIANISGSTTECVDLLRVLAQFTIFLDNASYVKLYANAEGDIPLLPFQSLCKGIRSASEYLSDYPSYQGSIELLQEIESLTALRFYAIARGPLQEAISATASEALAPSIDDLATKFGEWADRQSKGNGLELKEIVRTGLLMLEQSGVTDFGKFCQLVDEYDDEYGAAFRREAVRFGHLKDPQGRLEKEVVKEVLVALENPWQDPADIDFAKILEPETETLEIYYWPGSYGFYHTGHWDAMERLRLFFRYRENLYPEEKTQRIIVYMPITDATQVPHYDKDPAKVGLIYERVASMMILLAETDRRMVFITTALQSPPERALTIDGNIRHTTQALSAKIHHDLTRAEGVSRRQIRSVLCFGSDELEWKKTKEGGRRLSETQPKKVRPPEKKGNDCFCVGRWGDLVDLIANGQKFRRLTGVETLILTPGKERGSSTKAVDNFNTGDIAGIYVPAIPWIKRYWSETAIAWRRRMTPGTPSEVPSVTEIYKRFIKEYPAILKKEGLI